MKEIFHRRNAETQREIKKRFFENTTFFNRIPKKSQRLSVSAAQFPDVAPEVKLSESLLNLSFRENLFHRPNRVAVNFHRVIDVQSVAARHYRNNGDVLFFGKTNNHFIPRI